MLNKSQWGGGLLTVALSFLLIGLFWGFSWFANWRTNFFSTNSDDLTKDIYTTTWHVAYDDQMAMCNAMNYPHGEYYTFTGLQPVIAAPLQLLRKAGVQHTERAVLPLMNLWIFLSVVLCALFLYLIFVELKLPVWYSIVVALLVTLMSPQLQRMGGHMSLSYYCAIPMLIYFTLRHMRTLHWGWALALAFFGVLFGLCHPYYFVFYIFLGVCEIVALWVKDRKEKKNLLTSALLIVVLPVTLFYLLTHIGIPDGLHTTVPGGFHQYRGRIWGVLLPYGRLYFMEHSHLFSDISWEARVYVGAVAVVAIIVIVWHFFISLFKRDDIEDNRSEGNTGERLNSIKRKVLKAVSPTDNTRLNIILLAATILMLIACGLPLAWFPRNVVSYIGPFAQFRAQARFVWLFYYVINIVAFYGLFRLTQNSKLIIILALLVMAFEATAYNWRNKSWYAYNTIPQWTDYDNQLPQNQWLHTFDASQYQAILTLPVFNAGSESFYVWAKDNMFQKSAILSMKTGLPLICNESARSDIRQAWNCIALGRTAWDTLLLPEEMTDNRPLLLAVTPDSTQLSDAEMIIMAHATPLQQIEGVKLYSIHPSEFRNIVAETQDSLRKWYASSLACGKDSIQNSKFKIQNSPISGDIHKGVTLNDGILNNSLFTIHDSPEVEISFWMSNILDDMYSRCHLKVFATDKDGNTSQIFGWDVLELVDIVDIPNNDGLFRLRVGLPENTTMLRIEMRNREMRPSPVTFHHLLIRPVGTDVAIDGYFNNIPVTAFTSR